MKTIRYRDKDFEKQLRKVTAPSSLFDRTIEERTRAIVDAVGTRGDAALLEFTEKFDGAKLTAKSIALTEAELAAANKNAGKKLRRAVAVSSRNVTFFAKQSLRRNWSAKNAQGATVGEKFDPFQRVGIYIPGGTAPLVSTCLMTITLAKVAGCKEIVVCTPCGADGKVNEAILYAAQKAGATEIYRVGGAQAIAAMAHGTKTIGRVQKIYGPGNAYVVTAKRLLVGHVAIDLLPGPSELMVLADETANPAFAAADMLAQAEHGSGHERVWLVTTSAKLLNAVGKELEKQLPALSRSAFIQRALKKSGWLVQVKSIKDGVSLVNQLAPEHCEVMTKDAAKVSKDIVTAGAIFLGVNSPTVLGDYLAGPSHTLPTGGAGASFPGLTADQFQRRTSVVRYDRTAVKKSIETVQQFAAMEGLDAHGRSAEIRLDE
ncbi:MAG: histidinol dehydrogenase [Candidatus Binatia bacterium]|jgi:histidinol dehydrogenase